MPYYKSLYGIIAFPYITRKLIRELKIDVRKILRVEKNDHNIILTTMQTLDPNLFIMVEHIVEDITTNSWTQEYAIIDLEVEIENYNYDMLDELLDV